ncbi:acyl-CoA dehydrogenase family protein [Legionella oakridgensis]|uniref:acyl-CoA dehydrogenase family protein n=1 Tax=Legionella oakridgensis TaxID=29423 RepID=UPI0003DE6BA6|nr:acyl-CoA dehydrogenase family protein [Legionella oakridgensis]ETO93413.1 acyl-CoA dehydrogenase [Legionella oakridgensis RV-2-2007]
MINKDSYQEAREHFVKWNVQLRESILLKQSCLLHTYRLYFPDDPEFIQQLLDFSAAVANELEPVVMENNLDVNLPGLEQYNAIGERQDKVIHHPSYERAGDIIYGSGLMRYLLAPGQMLKTLSLFLLSSHAGEAGHNCPIACSAGVIRVLSHYSNLKETHDYLDKLTEPSFRDNYTGAQFLTEVQGGSDVGANATQAHLDEQQQWRITGEKWFCSNANADLILMTARFNRELPGTQGLGLFLVPSRLPNGSQNYYRLRRLKQKIGTRTMATAEIDFDGAFAYPMGDVTEGIHLVMENVLHLSRIFNAFAVLGMARRAYQIAYYYACNRLAFAHPIIDYPLVKEKLAHIKAENIAMLASIFQMVQQQDKLDSQPREKQLKKQLWLLRTLANLNKFFTAQRCVENIHHCLDVLAGNGTIESFSSLPRLLRDCIVCENWEGTHFTLWMQILRDMHKFNVDELFLAYLFEQLERVDDNNSHKPLFKSKIDDLTADIKTMKLLNFEEQSLNISNILEHMAVINAAIALTLETQGGTPPKSKKASLDLFIKRYLQDTQLSCKAYVSLLDAVLAIE